ncbi:ABC transporter permease [Metabacillus sp. RGM 3146]|uniref:ABC transporter permease n=1 Tax=Metabacillus sp. RGM 3146 TaxID=3401092 RepID=UPI003B9AC159
MNSVEEIWNKRLEEHLTEVRSYTRYMFNDHLLIVLVFMLGGGAVWYSNWLKHVPAGFPAFWIMALVYALVMLSTSVRTLLKEADIVFLLPLEKQMKLYFKKAIPYSYFSQLYMLLIPIVIFAPLYFAVKETSAQSYLLIVFQLLLIKGWNLWVNWLSSFTEDFSSKTAEIVIKFILNTLVTYFVLSVQLLFVLPLYVIMALLLLYYLKTAAGKGLKWEKLIEQENGKKQSFYRLANLFTDVPKLKKQAKRRKYLDWILSAISYRREHAYKYMFARAFIRGTDYFGVFIRLTIICGLILIFAGINTIGAVILVMSAVFLTGVQLIGLHKHYDLLMMPDLYPVSEESKKKGFYEVLQTVLLVQSAILAIFLLASAKWVEGGAGLLAGVVFTLLFVQGYVRARLNKSSRS